MSESDLTCPFCNARVTATPGLIAGSRITCSRCGEPFPLKTDIQIPPGITPGAPQGFASPTLPPMGKPYRRNRLVAGVVLGVMGVMAATGLAYALLTQDTRREHDKALPRRSRRPALPPLKEKEKEPPVVAVDPVVPARLAALGYLPADTGFVAGLHVQEMLASPAGKDLRQRPLKIATYELRLDTVKDLVGLPPEEIDHVILGVTVREGDMPDATPPVHLVVRTRSPFDRKQLLEKLEAGKSRPEKTPTGGKRDVYSVKVQNLPMALWLADERTFVLGLFTKLERVPEKPAEGIDHLPADLRQAINERLTTGMPLWLAGHAQDWSKTLLPSLVGVFKDVPMLDQIDKVRTFAVGVVPEKPVKVQGAFRCADESTAKKLESEQLAPRAKKEPDALKYGREGAWLTVQWKFAGG
jgi:hypothetical protein